MTMDETPVKAGHNKNKKKLQSGYFWEVYGDQDEVAFHFAPSRASPVVEEILGDKFAVDQFFEWLKSTFKTHLSG